LSIITGTASITLMGIVNFRHGVRHPRPSRWLDELGRLKGGRPGANPLGPAWSSQVHESHSPCIYGKRCVGGRGLRPSHAAS
jgi:hypothetical protein